MRVDFEFCAGARQLGTVSLSLDESHGVGSAQTSTSRRCTSESSFQWSEGLFVGVAFASADRSHGCAFFDGRGVRGRLRG